MVARRPGTADSRLEPNRRKRVMDAVEDYLENCAQVKVDIEVVESLIKPEKTKGFSKVHSEALNEKRQQYFPALRHFGEAKRLCGKQKTMAGKPRKNCAQQGGGLNEWHDIEYQGEMTEAPPCPERTLKTPLPQQSSSPACEEEARKVSMEDRRRRSIAFELRYLDNSEEVKVGIVELQERLEVLVHIGISIHQVAHQARSENGQKIFEVFWQEGVEVCVASWTRWEAQWKGLVELERRCQDISREIQMLSKRQEIFKNAIEGKPRVQSRAIERCRTKSLNK